MNLAEDTAQITDVCFVSISQRAFQGSRLHRVSVCALFFHYFGSSESTPMSVFQKDAKQVYLFQETEAQEASRNVSPFPLSTLSFFLSTYNINPSGVCILLVCNVHVKNNNVNMGHDTADL